MIALSCVISLSSNFSIFHPSTTDHEMRMRMINECHSLHPYAHDFWLQHVERYGQCQADLTSRHFNVLIEPLRKLLDAKRTLEMPEMKTLNEFSISKHEEILLGTLKSEPNSQSLIRVSFAFRRLMKSNEDIKDNVLGKLSKWDYQQYYCLNFSHFFLWRFCETPRDDLIADPQLSRS